MSKLCDRLNFPIRIVDTEVNELYKNPNFTEHKTIVISLGENHWYIFKQEVMSVVDRKAEAKKRKLEEKIKQKEDRKKKTILVFYDIESVFNADHDNMA